MLIVVLEISFLLFRWSWPRTRLLWVLLGNISHLKSGPHIVVCVCMEWQWEGWPSGWKCFWPRLPHRFLSRARMDADKIYLGRTGPKVALFV